MELNGLQRGIWPISRTVDSMFTLRPYRDEVMRSRAGEVIEALEGILLEGLFADLVLTKRVTDTISEHTFGMRSETRDEG